MTHQTPAVYPINLDQVPEIKLIACDMDGTLLDDDQAIHDDFWPLIDQLHACGIVFCPASGRQYYNLVECFKPIADKVIFIAENGAYVVRGGAELSSDCLTRDIAPYKCRFFHVSPSSTGNDRMSGDMGRAGQGSGPPWPRGNG